MNTAWLLFALLFFATNVIQTITGFAGGVLAMPFAMLLVGRPVAGAQINFLGLFLSLYIAFRERRHIRWRCFGQIIPFMGLGALAGMLAQRYLDFALVYRLYGGFILLSVALLALRKNQRPLWGPIGCALLFLAGAVHYVFVSGGPLLVIYVMGKVPQKDAFRATLNAVWVPVNLMLLAGHVASGLFTPSFLRLSAVLAPAMLLGMAVGFALYRRVNARAFLYGSYALLAVMGLYILLF